MVSGDKYKAAGGIFILLLMLVACAPLAAPTVTGTPLIAPTAQLTQLGSDTSVPGSTPTPTPTVVLTDTAVPRTTLLFTGVIVPARCVQAEIDARNDPHFLYDEVRDVILSADLAIGVLNAAISDFAPRTGCEQTYVLVGGSENADALQQAGFDIMNVATNHIKNCGLSTCGDRAFFDTLANLERVGILPVGAGANLAEALQPLVVEVNGVRFGFIAMGEIEEMVFAGEDTPGIAVLNEENLQFVMDAVRQIADVIIFMPHSGPENSQAPSALQRMWARLAVKAGADLVVMNHTHVAQGYHDINGVPVFYSLGNFLFDQVTTPAHRFSLMLQVVFEGDQLVEWQFIPTVTRIDKAIHLPTQDEIDAIMMRLLEVNESLP